MMDDELGGACGGRAAVRHAGRGGSAARSIDDARPPGLHRGVLRGVRVVVVDDDAEVRTAIASALEAVGAEVVAAGSADEALDALGWFRPVILVSDLGMPRRDGWSLVREVRTRPPERGGDVRAIALTAFSGCDVRRRTLEAGFQAHAVKPVETATLIGLVASLASDDVERVR